jgi:hypothetical protein
MTLTSLATSAFATTRSTFKAMAEAAVASGDDAASKAGAGTADRTATPAGAETGPIAAAVARQATREGAGDPADAKPKGIRRGTVLDAYA